MEIITVNAKSKSYNIYIAPGILQETGKYINSLSKVLIISDTNVYPLYGKELTDKLSNMGIKVHSFVYPASEENKNLTTVTQILKKLAQENFSRTDIIIGLGGGVCGDMAGFASSIYKRGIKYINIPTSLIALVDSSIGGKTGVDFENTKNIVGTFYQPHTVLADLDVLNSLPQSEINNGLGEIIKYAMIADANMFKGLQNGVSFKQYIKTCMEIKAKIVEQDELDLGERMKLNFGHTYAHAIEADSNYTIPHGQAVCIGMVIAAKNGEMMGLTKTGTTQKLIDLLLKLNLPYEYTGDISKLNQYILNDKKILDGKLNMILIKEIGEGLNPYPLNISRINQWIF